MRKGKGKGKGKGLQVLWTVGLLNCGTGGLMMMVEVNGLDELIGLNELKSLKRLRVGGMEGLELACGFYVYRCGGFAGCRNRRTTGHTLRSRGLNEVGSTLHMFWVPFKCLFSCGVGWDGGEGIWDGV